MANWNMVWLQQRQGPAATPPFFSLTEIGMTSPRLEENPLSREMEKRVEHLQRPTKSSQAKIESAAMRRMHIPHYKEKDSYLWDKMELLEDCKKCTWTPRGTAKQGSKI